MRVVMMYVQFSSALVTVFFAGVVVDEKLKALAAFLLGAFFLVGGLISFKEILNAPHP